VSKLVLVGDAEDLSYRSAYRLGWSTLIIAVDVQSREIFRQSCGKVEYVLRVTKGSAAGFGRVEYVLREVLKKASV